jgi:hypothetical protein
VRQRRANPARLATVVTGLAMATATFGSVGAGAASAARPGLHIKPGAIWTYELRHGGCEWDLFQSNGTFSSTSYGGDAGTWSGGKSTMNMSWTAGGDAGRSFNAAFVSTTMPVEYKGYTVIPGPNFKKSELVKGAVSTFDGVTC